MRAWVADGGYHGKLGDLVLERAELVVWLDPPLPTVLRRLGARTVRRVRSGEELWGGNRETWRGAFLSRDSLFVWALTTHRPRRARYEERLAGTTSSVYAPLARPRTGSAAQF